MNSQDKFILHTGLYGSKSRKTLDLLVRRMTDGSLAYLGEVEREMQRTGRLTDVVLASDGEILLTARPWWRSYRWEQDCIYYKYAENAGEIKRWYAWAIRTIYSDICADSCRDMNLAVKMRPSRKSCPTSKVWEIKATADALDGVDVKSKYGEKISDSIVGAQRDMIDVELNSCLAEEIDKIAAKYRRKKADVNRALRVELAQLRLKATQRRRDLDKEQRREVSQLRKNLKSGVMPGEMLA